jgi:predicted deacetylase
VNRIAVALHDVEPATFERCALIRDWLNDLGIDRATLLVTPAPELHPFADTRPELADWLAECVRAGDAVAQHGLQHPAARGRGGEFAGLDAAEARRALRSGRRLMHLAGVEPRGFVAPGYAYSAPLRRTLRTMYEWWATLGGVQRSDGQPLRAPALHLGALARLHALAAGPLLRLDLRPADLDRPRNVRAVERILIRAGDREAVTYDDLAAGAS